MQLECRLPLGQHSHDSAPSPLIYLPISVLLTLNPPSGCILSADRKRTKIEGCGRSKVIFRGRFDWFSASSRTACDCAVILTSVSRHPPPVVYTVRSGLPPISSASTTLTISIIRLSFIVLATVLVFMHNGFHRVDMGVPWDSWSQILCQLHPLCYAG